MIDRSLRRRKNYWTKKETEILKDAVSKYGKKWSIIQQKYPVFIENGRTQVDLKDKWRNLNGRSKIRLDSGDYETLNYIISERNYRPKRKSKKGSKRSTKSYRRSKKTSKRKSKKGSKRSKKSYRRSKKTSRRKSKKGSMKVSKIKYTIYSKEGCPYCNDAKKLLKDQNIPFKEIKVTDSNIETIYKKIDNKTNKYRYFPIIFKNDIFIGGFSDLDKNNL